MHRVAGDGTGQPRIGDAGDPVSEIGDDAGDPQSPVVDSEWLASSGGMVRCPGPSVKPSMAARYLGQADHGRRHHVAVKTKLWSAWHSVRSARRGRLAASRRDPCDLLATGIRRPAAGRIPRALSVDSRHEWWSRRLNALENGGAVLVVADSEVGTPGRLCLPGPVLGDRG